MTGVTVCFVSSTTGNRFMTEVLEGVATELTDDGVPVEFAFDHFPRFDAPTAYVVIPHEFFALADPHHWPEEDQLRRTISFCVEMPGTRWFDTTVDFAGSTGAAVCINRSATAELCRRGVPTEHFQLGYTRAWDRWHRDVSRPRPVDVIYMGSKDERRDRFLSGYAQTLWRHRSKLMIPPIAPRTARRPDYFLGDEKLELIGSSRALINLHRGDSRSFEWVRVLECISNGCVVVSEHSRDHEPLVPGEHFLSSAPESLGLLVDNLFREPERLETLQLSAYDHVTNELTMRPAARRLAEMADDVGDASRRSKRPPARPLTPPPHPGTGGTSPGPNAVDLEFASLRAGLHRLVIANLETRRLLQALFNAPGEGWDLDGVRVVARTPAMARVEPRVSVLVPLFNHENEVLEGLESVVSSRYQDFELLVYDDASSDRSLERVRGFLEQRPWFPAILLQGHVNRGPSRARNALAARARGDLLFMLDADNKIFPTTLERLVEALDANPSASFSYSMLAVHTGGVPDGLLSAQPWDPAELARENYIDTMALIRRDALIGVGGYGEDSRLTIWEDYDLWCRFAELGHEGALVPEILGVYRRTGHSRNTSAHIDAAAVRSLIKERAPTVFANVP